MMKNLIPFFACALCVFAPAMAGVYNAKVPAVPAGLIVSQRLANAGSAYGSAPYGASPIVVPVGSAYGPVVAPVASSYGPVVAPVAAPYGSVVAPVAAPYGSVAAPYGSGPGYANDAQVQSLVKIALAMPVPVPDAGLLNRNYGKQSSYVASPRAVY